MLRKKKEEKYEAYILHYPFSYYAFLDHSVVLSSLRQRAAASVGLNYFGSGSYVLGVLRNNSK